MAFTPIRLVSPDGVSVLVSNATDRETLLGRGYTPEPAPAPARAPERPRPVVKPADTKTSK
ncbi:hypothetical protein [Nocardia sp. NPDC060249]|uniref:hypothetical protein n=1 Tax=Nocardia sp. NPDC060249 TaxID=3347082 RepID=UPI0036595E10